MTTSVVGAVVTALVVYVLRVGVGGRQLCARQPKKVVEDSI